MGTVYAIANQKGGVGKTTTAVNLAACVAEAGYESLLVDIDPQSNATLGLGIDKHLKPTVYEALMGDLPLPEAIVETDIPHLSVVRDPNDDMVIATAVRAQAAYIVTRDKDLLSLQHYGDITMITPEAFIAIVRERGRLNP